MRPPHLRAGRDEQRQQCQPKQESGPAPHSALPIARHAQGLRAHVGSIDHSLWPSFLPSTRMQGWFVGRVVDHQHLHLQTCGTAGAAGRWVGPCRFPNTIAQPGRGSRHTGFQDCSPGLGIMESQERVVINCWSGPRCVSTSLMYSWAQRSDCQVRWDLQIGAEVQTAVLATLQHV